jgi:hypothetical protein
MLKRIGVGHRRSCRRPPANADECCRSRAQDLPTLRGRLLLGLRTAGVRRG